MTDAEELPQVISCAGAAMIGILHKPLHYQKRAVLIVVGGPQTRVGSHRQFILLARYLATKGIAVLRFDYRGMGDSEGSDEGFEHVSEDICAAIDLLWSQLPGIEEVVLWGLCDAASAVMMYAHRDARVAGVVLLNPWVRSETSEARAYLEHYYVSKLLSRDFWKNLLSGKVNVLESIGSLFAIVGKIFKGHDRNGAGPGSNDLFSVSFIDQMLSGLEAFSGRVLLIMSGNDLTAAEFNDLTSRSRRWKRALSAGKIVRKDIAEADHTFSRRTWRDQVSQFCGDWVKSW